MDGMLRTRQMQYVLIMITQAIFVASNLPHRDRQIFVGVMPSSSSPLTAWKATFENYLTDIVGKKYDPPFNFSLVPLISTTAAYEVVASGKVDFIYLNPSLYSCLESEHEGMP